MNLEFHREACEPDGPRSVAITSSRPSILARPLSISSMGRSTSASYSGASPNGRSSSGRLSYRSTASCSRCSAGSPRAWENRSLGKFIAFLWGTNLERISYLVILPTSISVQGNESLQLRLGDTVLKSCAPVAHGVSGKIAVTNPLSYVIHANIKPLRNFTGTEV
jgi:hypothetical protein